MITLFLCLWAYLKAGSIGLGTTLPVFFVTLTGEPSSKKPLYIFEAFPVSGSIKDTLLTWTGLVTS